MEQDPELIADTALLTATLLMLLAVLKYSKNMPTVPMWRGKLPMTWPLNLVKWVD